VTVKPLSNMAAAALAMAVPQIPVKWTDWMADENIAPSWQKHRRK
jgi:hypothetical protein